MDLALQVIGFIFLGAVLVKIALILGSDWRRLSFEKKQRILSLELLQHRVEVAKARCLEQKGMDFSWGGFRKFEIQRKVMEAQDICSFYLTPHDKKPLPPFKPGQHLTFRLTIPGMAKPIIRCYSLSDIPHNEQCYRVTIKKIPPPVDPPDVPAGLISTYFHEQVQEGEILDVKAPSGKFFLDLERETPLVLIAGGVGITPILSMLNTLIIQRSNREIWFFYGVINGANHIMKDHLKQISQEFDNVHLNVCYSRPSHDDILGDDYHHEGHVKADLFKRLLPSNNYEFYICGPPPMMASLTKDLQDWGVPEKKIFFEAFGSATVKKVSLPPLLSTPSSGMEIVFSKSGKRFPWDQGSGSLLEFAESNGISMDFGCRAGNCGTCLTAMKSGEVSYVTEAGTVPENGSCLTCICIPISSVILDA